MSHTQDLSPSTVIPGVSEERLKLDPRTYDLRYAVEPITLATWDAANPVQGELSPHGAGSLEEMTVGGLQPETTYHFALRVLDEIGNVSEISNLAPAQTEALAWDLEMVCTHGFLGRDIQ